MLDIFLCGITVLIELVMIILFTLLIQFIFYRVFNINLFRSGTKLLQKVDRYLNKKLYL